MQNAISVVRSMLLELRKWDSIRQICTQKTWKTVVSLRYYQQWQNRTAKQKKDFRLFIPSNRFLDLKFQYFISSLNRRVPRAWEKIVPNSPILLTLDRTLLRNYNSKKRRNIIQPNYAAVFHWMIRSNTAVLSYYINAIIIA